MCLVVTASTTLTSTEHVHASAHIDLLLFFHNLLLNLCSSSTASSSSSTATTAASTTTTANVDFVLASSDYITKSTLILKY
jgi:hypothetical protein